MNVDAELHYEKGNDASIKRQFEAAEAEYNRAIELDPDFADAYMRRAITFAERSMTGKAVDDLKQAADRGNKEASAALKAYYDIDY